MSRTKSAGVLIISGPFLSACLELREIVRVWWNIHLPRKVPVRSLTCSYVAHWLMKPCAGPWNCRVGQVTLPARGQHSFHWKWWRLLVGAVQPGSRFLGNPSACLHSAVVHSVLVWAKARTSSMSRMFADMKSVMLPAFWQLTRLSKFWVSSLQTRSLVMSHIPVSAVEFLRISESYPLF